MSKTSCNYCLVDCLICIVIEDFVVNMEEFLFSNGTLYMPGSAMSIMVNAVDNEVLEGNQDIVFNLITDVSLLPGLSVTIVNDTIEIIDDEGDKI